MDDMDNSDASQSLSVRCARSTSRRHTEESWNSFRPMIYQLYIVEKAKLETVVRLMRDRYNFEATPSMYARKLKKWDYKRNTSLRDVIDAQEQRCRRAGDNLPLKRNHTTDVRSIQRYMKANKLALRARKLDAAAVLPNDTLGPEVYDIPLTVSPTLPQRYYIDQTFLHHMEMYMRRSFYTGRWYFHSSEPLIRSSDSQDLAIAGIHSFLSGLRLGCESAAKGDRRAADLFWHEAFSNVDELVQNTYHDVLSNLIQGVSMLERGGHRDIAAQLRASISQSVGVQKIETAEHKIVLRLFQRLDASHIGDLEERVLELYHRIFEWHLGPSCYNTLVTAMNHAKLRLLRNSQLQVGMVLPDLSRLDHHLGRSHRHSMDVVRERAEILYHRADYAQALLESTDLIVRTSSVLNDEWLQKYYHLKGLYIKGSSKFHLIANGKDTTATAAPLAAAPLQEFLSLLDDFDKMLPARLFKTERAMVYERLGKLAHWSGHTVAEAEWHTKQSEELIFIDAMSRFVNP